MNCKNNKWRMMHVAFKINNTEKASFVSFAFQFGAKQRQRSSFIWSCVCVFVFPRFSIKTIHHMAKSLWHRSSVCIPFDDDESLLVLYGEKRKMFPKVKLFFAPQKHFLWWRPIPCSLYYKCIFENHFALWCHRISHISMYLQNAHILYTTKLQLKCISAHSAAYTQDTNFGWLSDGWSAMWILYNTKCICQHT